MLLRKEKFGIQIEQQARPAVKFIDEDKIRQLRIELEQKIMTNIERWDTINWLNIREEQISKKIKQHENNKR